MRKKKDVIIVVPVPNRIERDLYDSLAQPN